MKIQIKETPGIVFLTFLQAALVLASFDLQAQAIGGDTTIFKFVRSAKVVVSQNYGEATGVFLPIESVVFELLALTNLNEDNVKPDLLISVFIKGEPLVAQYRKGVSFENFYTGAKIEAIVSFKFSNGIEIKRSYENTTEPPGLIKESRLPGKSPNQAPFRETFELPMLKALFYCAGKSLGISLVVKSLESNEVVKRNAAAEILGELKNPVAIEQLISAIHHDRDNKPIVAAILAIKDTCIVLPLIHALQNKYWEVREAAAKALGPLKDPRAVEPLIQLLADQDSFVSGAAAWSLGMIEDSRAVMPLISALNGKNVEAIAQALGKIKDPRAVDPLIEELRKGKNQAAARALGFINDKRAIDPLIEALNADDTRVVAAAAEALGSIKDTSAVGPLIAELKTESTYVVKAVAEALATIGDPRAAEPLIATLRKGDFYALEAIKKALIALKDIHSVKPLVAALNDNNKNVREAAAEILGEIGDTQARNPLIIAVNDQDLNVSAAAATSLITIVSKDIDAVEFLINALREDHSPLQSRALEALKKMTNKDFGYDFEKWQKWWHRKSK